MKTQFTKGICANCGADKGLHHFETEQCPKNGIEENRFDNMTGKYYPQRWESTTFEDSGIKKLSDAAPEMYQALISVNKYFVDLQNKCALTNSDEKAWKMAAKAIKKATE